MWNDETNKELAIQSRRIDLINESNENLRREIKGLREDMNRRVKNMENIVIGMSHTNEMEAK